MRCGGCEWRQGSCLLLIAEVIRQENGTARLVMDCPSLHPNSQSLSKIDELISSHTAYKGPWRGHPCTVPAVPSLSLTRLVWALLWDLQWIFHISLGNEAVHNSQLRKAFQNIHPNPTYLEVSCPIDMPATKVLSSSLPCAVLTWMKQEIRLHKHKQCLLPGFWDSRGISQY